ncbi:MAG: helix-turn-helix domain-containing protein [Sphingomonas sp.]|uniref:helix-turn-helix domain-containing protein n=1 Tax=Sphingomonas sp. TaxID=28214 RepID=UPI0035A863C1|nr:helix-turn-helix domain-containing protein [Sphingomonas sp.]
MATNAVHKEDVKAVLRKRYGSIDAFQDAKGLSGQQVRDLMRGKSSAAREAVAQELGVDADHLVITSGKLPVSGNDSGKKAGAHRKSAGAQ